MVGMTRALTRETLLTGVRELCSRDRDLAGIVEAHGPPPLWARRPGFPTLVRIILEQQVSLASADAAWRRLRASIGPPTPEALLELDDRQLKEIGFSRQKAGYCRGLATGLLDGSFRLAGLGRLDDDAARAELERLKGVGRWTSDIYLLMALRRPDIWPTGDIALASAARRVKRLRQRPTDDKLATISAEWAPWRAVGARLLWHYYLST